MKHLTLIALLFLAVACGGEDDALYMTESDVQDLQNSNICQTVLIDGNQPPDCDLDN